MAMEVRSSWDTTPVVGGIIGCCPSSSSQPKSRWDDTPLNLQVSPHPAASLARHLYNSTV